VDISCIFILKVNTADSSKHKKHGLRTVAIVTKEGALNFKSLTTIQQQMCEINCDTEPGIKICDSCSKILTKEETSRTKCE
jgi:hypothetical protein